MEHPTPHRPDGIRAAATARSSGGGVRAGLGALALLTVMLTASVAVALLPSPVRAAEVEPGWRWPLAGEPAVVRAFDPPATRWGSGHRGVDLEAPRGGVVVAAGRGRVAFAGVVAGRGVVSVVHAGGLRTTYEPVEPRVRTGDLVVAGAILGTLGSRGGHCLPGSCLHWGLRRGEAYLDPLSLVGGGGPVRLLPVWDRGPARDRLPGQDRPLVADRRGRSTVPPDHARPGPAGPPGEAGRHRPVRPPALLTPAGGSPVTARDVQASGVVVAIASAGCGASAVAGGAAAAGLAARRRYRPDRYRTNRYRTKGKNPASRA